MSRPSEQPCGTYARYQSHKRKGEPIDEDCDRANREYQEEWRSRGDRWRKRQTMATRARRHALNQLADLHPAEFNRLHTYAMKEELEREGAENAVHVQELR